MKFLDGPRLTRTDENVAEIEALIARLGGEVGSEVLFSDLNRRARRALPWGRAVHRAYTWDAADRATKRWWPQGISTSADASDTEDVEGSRLVVVAWYYKDAHGQTQGSRLTFLDLDTLRYRHVLLVQPRLREGRLHLDPLKVHAGGIVWWGPFLHIAATTRGFFTVRVDDVLRIPDEHGAGFLRQLGIEGDEAASYGYRYLLPVRFAYRAGAADGHDPMRFSFASLDRASLPTPSIITGEYTRTGTARLARFPLDRDRMLPMAADDGAARPIELDELDVRSLQGATFARGRYHLSVSRGPWRPGTVYAGTPGAWTRHRWALPPGPEDIAYWPSTDLLWSVTEHPHRRWVVSMRRSRFD